MAELGIKKKELNARPALHISVPFVFSWSMSSKEAAAWRWIFTALVAVCLLFLVWIALPAAKEARSAGGNAVGILSNTTFRGRQAADSTTGMVTSWVQYATKKLTVKP